ncbi:hypothetical protein [Streptomyces sp. NPDC050264]
MEIFFSTPTRRVLRRGQVVTAYDKHDAKPYRWTYDGTPLKAT